MSAPFVADLHIHSKYSRACSRDCDLENLTWWARRKGISLVGTGDFTHPAWNAHLRDVLVPAEPGLYRLNDELQAVIDERTPMTCQTPVRFMLSVEISTIYKRDDRTRKVHHLVYLPDLDAVARFNKTLGAIGNLGSDGRPILGLDSRDLLEITLESSPDGYLVPAHIWTPWFAALGSKSGFDAIADCYADLADQIFAVETGLSSDPEMNWRVSSLDSYTLVSNSDAHSPPILGREATIFDGELDYFAIREALRANDGRVGTIEFFPEEGKYHLDGHRACGVRWEPARTKVAKTLCDCCGKPVTVGVQHRVDDLADRALGTRRPGAAEYHSLVPLPEIIGELRGRGPKTKTVLREIDRLVGTLGPELEILRTIPVDEIARVGGSDLAEALRRLRAGKVIRESGYDGEYGVIRLFDSDEIAELRSGTALFALPTPSEPATPAPAASFESANSWADFSEIGPEKAHTNPDFPEIGPSVPGLDPEQAAAVQAPLGPLLIVAGPGTGKTRTLTHRIAHLVRELAVPAERILAITFTRRAAGEMTERLASLLAGDGQPTVGTFHALCLGILRDEHSLLGLSGEFRVAEAEELRDILTRLGGAAPAGKLTIPAEYREAVAKELRAADRIALDDLVGTTVELLESRPELAERYRQRWPHVFVDEYQDVDETQYRLLRILAPADANLCVIGDPDQAIYSFRGADVGFFLRFAEDYPDAHTVRLHRNYRSAAPIVAAALRVLDHSAGDDRTATAIQPKLTATQGGANLIGWFPAAHQDEEAERVARSIDDLLGGVSFHSIDSGNVDGRERNRTEFSLADIAVLYRSGAQAGPVMRALTKAGIPFQRHSHDPFSHRAGVGELVRAMRWGAGRSSVDGSAGSASVAERLTAAAKVLERRLASGIDSDARGLRTVDVWSAVEALIPVARDCGADTERFLAQVATGVSVDAFDPRADAVTLLTLHAAKGLEFDVVFIVGCTDGTMPLRYGNKVDAKALAEERRLFFVGTTRARKLLFLSGTVTPERRRSPFVDAIGAELLVTGAISPRKPRRDQQLRLL